jgi:hypothetical protein
MVYSMFSCNPLVKAFLNLENWLEVLSPIHLNIVLRIFTDASK